MNRGDTVYWNEHGVWYKGTFHEDGSSLLPEAVLIWSHETMRIEIIAKKNVILGSIFESPLYGALK